MLSSVLHSLSNHKSYVGISFELSSTVTTGGSSFVNTWDFALQHFWSIPTEVKVILDLFTLS